MKKTIYDRIGERIDILDEIFKEFYFNKESSLDVYEKYGSNLTDNYRYSIEFDQLKNDYPDTYPNYLSYVLWRYQQLQKFYCFADRSINSKIGRINLSIIDCINQNIKHLNFLLNPDNKIHPKKELKPVNKPKGKTKLTRKQTALLFWYLREKQLIAQPNNENISFAISILSDHSKDQIQDIIKSPGTPVYQLGKGDDKITRQDFKEVISELTNLIRQIEKDLKVNTDNNELR